MAPNNVPGAIESTATGSGAVEGLRIVNRNEMELPTVGVDAAVPNVNGVEGVVGGIIVQEEASEVGCLVVGVEASWSVVVFCNGRG